MCIPPGSHSEHIRSNRILLGISGEQANGRVLSSAAKDTGLEYFYACSQADNVCERSPVCHPGESWDPSLTNLHWIPGFAEMTILKSFYVVAYMETRANPVFSQKNPVLLKENDKNNLV